MAANRSFSVACPHNFDLCGADPQMRSGKASQHPHYLIKRACHVLTGQRDRFTTFGRDDPTPDGTGVRDYVHVTDLAEAHICCCCCCALALPIPANSMRLIWGTARAPA